MKLVKLENIKEIKQAIDILEFEFKKNHTFFENWLRMNCFDFFSEERVIIRIQKNGEVVGYIMLHNLGKYLKINAIYIFEQNRNNGICQEALNKLVSMMKAYGFIAIFGQCREEYHVSKKILMKSNFIKIGTNFNKMENKNNLLYCYTYCDNLSEINIKQIAETIYSEPVILEMEDKQND